MRNSVVSIVISLVLLACQTETKIEIDQNILSSLGEKHKIGFEKLSKSYEQNIAKDSLNAEAYVDLAESKIILYVFGFIPRNESIPSAKIIFDKAFALDSLNSGVQKLSGILHFLDKEWEQAELSFIKSIEKNPTNLNARHWYALYLIAMNRVDEAMQQSDIIMELDTKGNYLLSRGSFFYFQYRFEEMKPLMLSTIEMDPDTPWAYDWLGMAYNGLNEHQEAIDTYLKAFELSDGTVEVGAGLGHALGLGGEKELAKQMADYYSIAAKEKYLPPVQRSFIHLGIGEYDEALALLEQAYKEESWFLLFMQKEHWYDPIRNDNRFIDILNRMNFPEPRNN
jgi:tetratricopeptide (TPR) repeat protein